MESAPFWIVLGGAAWVVIAVAILGRVVPLTESRVLGRIPGARCILGAVIGIGLLALVLGFTGALPSLPRNVAWLATHVGMAAFLLGFAWHVDPGRDALGLAGRRAPVDLARGVLVYVAFIPVVVASHVLNAWLLGDQVDAAQKSVHEILTQQGPERVMLILNVVLAVPLFEEIVFRGFLQQGIKSQLSLVAPGRVARGLAVVLASVGFSVLHEPATYLPVFVLSLLLGAAFEKSGRLLVPVALHATHNLAVVMFESFPSPFGGSP